MLDPIHFPSAETKVHAKPACKDVAFGCPVGYECRTPEKGCKSHCDCYDPVANKSLPQGCPIRVRPCQEGRFCVPDTAGECYSCNCDSEYALELPYTTCLRASVIRGKRCCIMSRARD
ncbi:hypothetical protein V5799_023954 [Amblyomma americanum]|uniref:Uncharacterized protein n=1 Tax=Amblyomma americanum TaxID=6943 RepID=A0AAQ4FHT6_AMBAM